MSQITHIDLPAVRTDGKLYRAESGGYLPQDHGWLALENRWDHHAARFDLRCPELGRWIAEDWWLRHEHHYRESCGERPPPPECKGGSGPGGGGSVPEPGSFVLLAVGLVVAFWRMRQ